VRAIVCKEWGGPEKLVLEDIELGLTGGDFIREQAVQLLIVEPLPDVGREYGTAWSAAVQHGENSFAGSHE